MYFSPEELQNLWTLLRSPDWNTVQTGIIIAEPYMWNYHPEIGEYVRFIRSIYDENGETSGNGYSWHWTEFMWFIHDETKEYYKFVKLLPLKKVWVKGGYLKQLPDLPLSITYLYCYNINLIKLPDPLPFHNLIYLNCSDNYIRYVPKLPDSMEEIYTDPILRQKYLKTYQKYSGVWNGYKWDAEDWLEGII